MLALHENSAVTPDMPLARAITVWIDGLDGWIGAVHICARMDMLVLSVSDSVIYFLSVHNTIVFWCF